MKTVIANWKMKGSKKLVGEYKRHLDDFESFVSLTAGLNLSDSSIKQLKATGLCKLDTSGDIQMTSEGIELQREMRLEARLMKKVKITGDDASVMIDEMMKELN